MHVYMCVHLQLILKTSTLLAVFAVGTMAKPKEDFSVKETSAEHQRHEEHDGSRKGLQSDRTNALLVREDREGQVSDRPC